MMIAANFVLVLGLGLAVLTDQFTIPPWKVKIADNGMRGYILHQLEDNQKSGLDQGHNIQARSHGSEFRINSDFADSDDGGGLLEDDDGEEVLVASQSQFGGYGRFHSFLPYPPPHHGPHPGPYPSPFGQQHNSFPGHAPQGGWGHGNGFGPGNGFGHGYGNDHKRDNDCHPGQGNNFGHGPVHGYGHGHGFGHGNHPPGFGHGHVHGHGNDGHVCDFDGSSEERRDFYSTEPVPTQVIPERVTPVVTQPTQSLPSTEEPTTTPVYDIDVRLGSSNRK